MPHIYLDFETRSKCDLKVHGQARYAADPSTIPLMLAYGTNKKYNQWILPNSITQPPVCPADLDELARDPLYQFHAYNAPFEMYIWHEICFKRWGWAEIPLDRWTCTMAKAAHANQPQYLGGLLIRLNMDKKFHKDAKGKNLIKALSLPTKLQATYQKNILDEDGNPLKILDEEGNQTRRNQKAVNTCSKQYAEEVGADIFTIEDKPGEYFFRNDRDLMKEYREYNVQDIVAEEAADKILPPVPDHERETWLLDRKINQRGIPIDRKLCEGAVKIFDQEVDDAIERLSKITGGEITSGGQVARIKEFVEKRVDSKYFHEGLKSEQVDAFLARYDGHPERWNELRNESTTEIEEAIDVLKIRKLVGGAAVKKYQAALNYANDDDRCREQLRYYRASTGRWGGSGVQPHNFKRVKSPDESVFQAIATGDWHLVRMFADLMRKSVPELLTDCLRGLIQAEPGNTFIVSDFAGIEARVLHWLVDNETMLQLFRDGADIYKHAAMNIYGVGDVEQITKDQRQIGKAAQLGLGYGMGWKTFLAGAIRAGQDMDEDFARMVVSTWRATNPEVPTFWWGLDAVATKVVKAGRRGKKIATSFGKLTIGYDPGRKYLIIRLPSGRNLYYYDPVVKKEEDAGGKLTDNLYYWDGKKGFTNTYGGKLTENIVQALARDLLVYSMKIIDAAGLDLFLHVHDEAAVETPKEKKDETFDIVHKAMETVPDWATGLPLEAETYESERYTK